MADGEVRIAGGVTRDPELRFTAGGQAVCSFTVAVSRRYQQNGEWKEQTSFIEVSAWGTLGENVAESITKGARVIVTGRLEQQTWEDKQTGEKRSKVIVVADDVGPSLKWATAQVTPRRKATASVAASTGPNEPSVPEDNEPF